MRGHPKWYSHKVPIQSYEPSDITEQFLIWVRGHFHQPLVLFQLGVVLASIPEHKPKSS